MDDTIRKKYRQDILNKDKAISSEIFRRVQKQAEITAGVPGQSTTDLTEAEASLNSSAEEASNSLEAVLDEKIFELEQRAQGNIQPTGANKDANIKKLLNNTDFTQAWNKFAGILGKIGLSGNQKDLLNQLTMKSDELVNACVYGYGIMLRDALNVQGAQTYLNKLAGSVFKATTLYEYVQSMYRGKAWKKITDKEFNQFYSNQFEKLTPAQQAHIYQQTGISTLNKDVRTDFTETLRKRNAEFRRVFGRDMSPNEEIDFRRQHFGKLGLDPAFELQNPRVAQDIAAKQLAYDTPDPVTNLTPKDVATQAEVQLIQNATRAHERAIADRERALHDSAVNLQRDIQQQKADADASKAEINRIQNAERLAKMLVEEQAIAQAKAVFEQNTIANLANQERYKQASIEAKRQMLITDFRKKFYPTMLQRAVVEERGRIGRALNPVERGNVAMAVRRTIENMF